MHLPSTRPGQESSPEELLRATVTRAGGRELQLPPPPPAPRLSSAFPPLGSQSFFRLSGPEAKKQVENLLPLINKMKSPPRFQADSGNSEALCVLINKIHFPRLVLNRNIFLGTTPWCFETRICPFNRPLTSHCGARPCGMQGMYSRCQECPAPKPTLSSGLPPAPHSSS